MANTTTATANDGIPTIVANQIIPLIREKNIWSNFVYVDRSLLGGPGLAVSIPTSSTTLTATSITTGANEGDAQATQAMSTGVVTITAASKVVLVETTDLVVDSSTFDLTAHAKEEISRTMSAAIETGITDLFGGADNVEGTSGVDMVIANLRGALTTYRINAGDQAEGAVFGLHPQQIGDLEADALSGSGVSLSQMLVRQDIANFFGGAPGSSALGSYVGSWMNVPIFSSTLVGLDGGSANREGALFKPSVGNSPQCAFGMAWKWLPDLAEYDNGVNLKLTHVLRGKFAVGFSEMVDLLFVSLTTDA